MQRCTSPLGGSITAADTGAHAFPAGPALFVYLSTPTGNAGTVTITDAASGTGGLVLGAGVGVALPAVKLGPLLSLESLAYKFSNAGDVLNYLVLR